MNSFDQFLAAPYTDSDATEDAIENKRSELDAMGWKELQALVEKHLDGSMVAEAVMEQFGDTLAKAIIDAEREDALQAEADHASYSEPCYD